MYFMFRGKRYDEAEKPTFAEMTFAEGKWGKDIGEWSMIQGRMTTFYMAIKRADPGLLTWEALLNLGPADFEEHWELDEAEADPNDDPENWPVDPTVAGTRTEAPSESGPKDTETPTTPVSLPYSAENSSGNSPQYFDSPPA
jgi:hypothetical protein